MVRLEDFYNDYVKMNMLRSGKGCWLDRKDGDFAEKVLRRAALMANLSLVHYQNMQMINYAIGGHYVQHYDIYQVSYSKLFSTIVIILV